MRRPSTPTSGNNLVAATLGLTPFQKHSSSTMEQEKGHTLNEAKGQGKKLTLVDAKPRVLEPSAAHKNTTLLNLKWNRPLNL